ncbi:MAG: diguanylate cyclase [Asticcacaulis sp.]|uniref:GGDEF domain-containing protein n=1 Tax=Asticcacaulis sp. TaxID=1872648 RepID=UPI0039E65826
MATAHISDQSLLKARLEPLYESMIPTAVLTGVAIVVLAIVYWSETHSDFLLAWLTISFCLLLLRGALVMAYRRWKDSRKSPRFWANAAIGMTGLAGVNWGSGLMWMIGAGSEFQVSVAAAMSLGAISLTIVNLSYWPNHTAFQLPILLLGALGFASAGRPEYLILAIACLLFCVAQVIVARRLGGTLFRAMSLSAENRLMAQDLAARSEALEALNRALEIQSRSDPLTSLANRRAYDERLASEWARAERSDTALALLSIDVDFFKRYNDTYGHSAGDHCLQAVAAMLANGIRQEIDLAARPGGEEFALILPDTPLPRARLVAERVRKLVENVSSLSEFNLPRQVTVSIGLAVIHPAKGQTLDMLSWDADEALYRAKETGRNRVETAAERLPKQPKTAGA